MNELTNYESIQALKATATPIDTAVAKAKERHDRFERFINSLKGRDGNEALPSENSPSVNRDSTHGL